MDALVNGILQGLHGVSHSCVPPNRDGLALVMRKRSPILRKHERICVWVLVAKTFMGFQFEA